MSPQHRVQAVAGPSPVRLPTFAEVWNSAAAEAAVATLRPLVGMLLLARMLRYVAHPESGSTALPMMMPAFWPFVVWVVKCGFASGRRIDAWNRTGAAAACTVGVGCLLLGDRPTMDYFKVAVPLAPVFGWTCLIVFVQSLLWEPFLRPFRTGEAWRNAARPPPFRRAMFWILAVYLALFEAVLMGIAYAAPDTLSGPGAFGKVDLAVLYYLFLGGTGVLVWALTEAAGFAFAPHFRLSRRLLGGAALLAVFAAAIQYVHQWDGFALLHGPTLAWFRTALYLSPCLGSAILCGAMIHRFPPSTMHGGAAFFVGGRGGNAAAPADEAEGSRPPSAREA